MEKDHDRDGGRLGQFCLEALQGDGRAVQFLEQYARAVGPEGVWLVPLLRQMLSDTETRDFAAFALEAIGPAAYEAVPELIQAIRYDPDNYASGAFLAALHAIGPDARDAVPTLLEIIANTNGSYGEDERLRAEELVAALSRDS